MGTIYGSFLSFSTKALTGGDAPGGLLPVQLPGTGVTVLVDGVAAPIWYASPAQVNFQAPGNLRPGRNVAVYLSRDGKTGPVIEARLAAESPGLFALDPEFVIAVRPDGTIARFDSPVRPGEIVILYANGLGETFPPAEYRRIPAQAAPITRIDDFRVILDDETLPAEAVLYAGAAPGFAGLYQINLRLPATVAEFPRIQLALGESVSPNGPRLPVR